MNKIKSFILLVAALACWCGVAAQVEGDYDEDAETYEALTITALSPASADDSCDSIADSLASCREAVSAMGENMELLVRRIDSLQQVHEALTQRLRQFVQLKDSLVSSNDLYQRELQEKNRLMSDQVRALQEKEQLLAEREELYRRAQSASDVDKAKLEGELKAMETSIDAKGREIAYLQKDIDAMEVTLHDQRENYNRIMTEKERYRQLVDSLQRRVNQVELENVRKIEENKYLAKKAEEAEAKAAISLNKKKKVRPIQGIAMRFFRTPDWDTRLTVVDGNTRGVIRNKNAGDIEFDFVTGASVMLWDLSDYFNNPKPRVSDSASRGKLPDIEIPRFDQTFNYDLGFYVGFGGSNLFKNFYIGPSFRFVDFFYFTIGVNVCEYEILTGGYKEGSLLENSDSLEKITAKSWLVKPFLSFSIDLDFLSYIKK